MLLPKTRLPDTVRYPVAEGLARLQRGLTELAQLTNADPDSPGTDQNHFRFKKVCEAALIEFIAAEQSVSGSALRGLRKEVAQAVRPFWGDSAAFSRCQLKPLGYPGDYQLMDLIVREVNQATGLGHHFDRLFLNYPGCAAIRNRSRWVVESLREIILAKTDPAPLTVLDIGCGPMAIEETLVQSFSGDSRLNVIGFDADADALELARARFQHGELGLELVQGNVLSQEGLNQLCELASRAKVIISMGLIEYLEDTTVELVLRKLHAAAKPGTQLFVANYVPDHPSRAAMEWFLDWWLVHRTESELRSLVESAGFEARNVTTRLDRSGSIVLCSMIC